MQLRKACLLVVLLYLPLISLIAQNAIIEGYVVDQKNGEAIIGATVYVSNTSYGVVTDEAGYFKMSRMPALPFWLNISYLGYETQVMEISLIPDTLLQVQMVASDVELETVTVYADSEKQWELYGAFFLETFIGYSSFAKQCELLNPQDVYLAYDRKQNVLRAYAKAPLVIHNKALGYEITYWMEGYEYDYKTQRLFFEGYPLYKDLIKEGTKKRKRRRWERNRSRAYNGSLMHFLRSLYKGMTEEEGFVVDIMQRLDIHEAYSAADKQVDTLKHSPKILEEIGQIIAAESSQGATGVLYNRYLNKVQQWYQNSNDQGFLRLFPDLLSIGMREGITVLELRKITNGDVQVIRYPYNQSIESQATPQKKIAVITERGIDPVRFIREGQNAEKELQFSDYLYIMYRKEYEEAEYQKTTPYKKKRQHSVLYILGDTAIRLFPNGYYTPNWAFMVEQYWSYEKMDKLLPLDYQPKGE